jgi:hypothetical protein
VLWLSQWLDYAKIYGGPLCRHLSGKRRIGNALAASAIAGIVKRAGRTRDGRVAYALKTPYRDGTIRVILEPKEFVAPLVALGAGPAPRGAPRTRGSAPARLCPKPHRPSLTAYRSGYLLTSIQN